MKEVGSELVFALLQLLLRDVLLLENRDVQGVLLALQQVGVKEVDNLARVLPGPSAQDSGAIDCILAHIVVEEWVEVQVR